MILITYFHCLFTKNLLLGVHSIILNLYYDMYILEKKDYSTNYRILNRLAYDLKDKYHNFTFFYHEYNVAIGHEVSLLYKKNSYTKLIGYWKVIEYESEYINSSLTSLHRKLKKN